MNIKEFKEGDIITRNEAGGYQKEDGSYCGDRLIFKGHDPISKIIFFENTELIWNGSIQDLSYGRDNWEEGWCFYPETLWQKVKKIIKIS